MEVQEGEHQKATGRMIEEHAGELERPAKREDNLRTQIKAQAEEPKQASEQLQPYKQDQEEADVHVSQVELQEAAKETGEGIGQEQGVLPSTTLAIPQNPSTRVVQPPERTPHSVTVTIRFSAWILSERDGLGSFKQAYKFRGDQCPNWLPSTTDCCQRRRLSSTKHLDPTGRSTRSQTFVVCGEFGDQIILFRLPRPQFLSDASTIE
jgi:hypothetical protein